LALAAMLACTFGCVQLKSGRCDSNDDCDKNLYTHCDTARKECVKKMDAGTGGTAGAAGAGGAGGASGASGAGGGAGHDAGVDKRPPSCQDDAGLCGGNTPICQPTGGCAACQTDQDCQQLNSKKPICMPQGYCDSCHENGQCATLDHNKPLCDTNDGGVGVCVQCLTSDDCNTDRSASTCRANVCGPCGSDNDCTNFPPGVCKSATAAGADAAATPMHCATPDEVIYVEKSAHCSDSLTTADAGTADGGAGQPGSATRPFCSMEHVRDVLGGARKIVHVSGTVTGADWSYNDEAHGPLLIVGPGSISGGAGPGFQMQAGDVTIRGITFLQGADVGIEATGGTLRLDHVTVKGCLLGGIRLDKANFDIQNTTVTGNGPGMFSGFQWGGILATTIPPSGLKNINQCTVTGNNGAGITCSDTVTGKEILASGNGTPDVSPTCGLPTTCADAGAMCGAQP
jgi:hypothetical protein